MTKAVSILRKVIILAIGVPLFGLGIVLIPLPGPGVLVSLLALFILSLEFDQAKPYRDKTIAKIKDIYIKSKERADKIAGD